MIGRFFKNNVLTCTLVPLTILFFAASYYRFMVSYDYLVAYEGDCDPVTESCYVYCEDEACSEPFYYSEITRSAKTLVAMCGEDITECDAAYSCPAEEAACVISYCDPTSGTCDDI